mmetsp:Transcript_70549/g.160161  ORF Transcript_70549/g.160161 Transcript_70549/m.160161 type:complete len:404 (-) Transcript_70549:182-1393(-)
MRIVLVLARPARLSRVRAIVHRPVEPEHVTRRIVPEGDDKDVAPRQGLAQALDPTVLRSEGLRWSATEVLCLGLAVLVCECAVDLPPFELDRRDLEDLAILAVRAPHLCELPVNGNKLGCHRDGLRRRNIAVVKLVEVQEAITVWVDVAAKSVAHTLTLRTRTLACIPLADVVPHYLTPALQLTRVCGECGSSAISLPQVHLSTALRCVSCVWLASDRLHAPWALGVAVSRADACSAVVAAVRVHLYGVKSAVHAATQRTHVDIEADLFPQKLERKVLLPGWFEHVQARTLLRERDCVSVHRHAVRTGVVDEFPERTLAAVLVAAVLAVFTLLVVVPTPVLVNCQAKALHCATRGGAGLHRKGKRSHKDRLLLIEALDSCERSMPLASSCTAQENRCRHHQPQ